MIYKVNNYNELSEYIPYYNKFYIGMKHIRDTSVDINNTDIVDRITLSIVNGYMENNAIPIGNTSFTHDVIICGKPMFHNPKDAICIYNYVLSNNSLLHDTSSVYMEKPIYNPVYDSIIFIVCQKNNSYMSSLYSYTYNTISNVFNYISYYIGTREFEWNIE